MLGFIVSCLCITLMSGGMWLSITALSVVRHNVRDLCFLGSIMLFGAAATLYMTNVL